MNSLLFAVVAYLLGSVSFAIVVSRLFRLEDPRTFGSGNPGATNVLRTGNKLAATLTLLGDCAKGWLAVALAVYFSERLQLDSVGIALIAFAVFAGHLWPVFFRFKGGKGVATAAGVLFGIDPLLGLATLATWLIVAFFTRYSSLAALASAVFAPAYYFLGHRVVWYVDNRVLLAAVVMSAMLIWRHPRLPPSTLHTNFRFYSKYWAVSCDTCNTR